MTRKEALASMPDDYSRAELQLIWETSVTPISELMALIDVSRGEAMTLWNARKNGHANMAG